MMVDMAVIYNEAVMSSRLEVGLRIVVGIQECSGWRDGIMGRRLVAGQKYSEWSRHSKSFL